MSILIKNGRIITTTDDYRADILIEGEKVSAIGSKLEVAADTIIDASGKFPPAEALSSYLAFPTALAPILVISLFMLLEKYVSKNMARRLSSV